MTVNSVGLHIKQKIFLFLCKSVYIFDRITSFGLNRINHKEKFYLLRLQRLMTTIWLFKCILPLFTSGNFKPIANWINYGCLLML